jgi:hypothetical protein
MQSTPRIFVSMGWPYTEDYARFREELEKFLRDHCRVDPRIIGKNEYPPGNPLDKIDQVIRECDGVMIVAYERKRVLDGLEKPGGKDQKAIAHASYTTPWNHVESAIAFSLRKPMYILVQRGLVQEGLIENKADWYVQETEFTLEALRSDAVSESISAWVRERIAPRHGRRRSLLEGFSKLRLSDFTMEDWIAFGALISGAFGAGVAIGHWLPHLP